MHVDTHCASADPNAARRWNVWKVGGRTPREVFHAFYFNDSGASAVAIDSLVYPQNPSCPVWT